MKRLRMIQGAAVALACMGMFVGQLARASQPLVTDVALARGGVLAGKIVDRQGAPQAGETIRVIHQGQVIGTAQTDNRGEFTVAKDQNIRLRSGWFSDRSACYLASARPVITQDTAFGAVLPTGQGLFAFRTMEDILAAVESIERDYAMHSRAAREIAEEFFSAEKVVGSLMARAGLA